MLKGKGTNVLGDNCLGGQLSKVTGVRGRMSSGTNVQVDKPQEQNSKTKLNPSLNRCKLPTCINKMEIFNKTFIFL